MIPYRMNPMGISGLPYKRRLSYLESTGTQWIDTGWSQANVISTYSYRISYRYTDSNVQSSLWGCINSNPVVGYGQIYRDLTTSSSLWCGNNNISANLNRAIETGIDYIDSVSVDLSNNIVSRNGASNTVSFSKGRGTDSAVLFATRLANAIAQQAHIRCYHFQLWQDNVLEQDFIPVLDFNDTPCIFDKVSKQFFYNQGTGQFLYA